MPQRVEIQINETGNAQERLQGLASGLGGLGTAALAASAVAVAAITAIGVSAGKAVVDFGVKAVQMAGDANEVASKFDTVFGESASRARAALDQFSKAAGRSKFELYQLAAGTQDLLVPLGFARKEAANMSVDLVKLATDMGSFSNIPMADVMRDVQSALTGSTEVMKKYGVVVNETTTKQELLNEGLDPANVTPAQKAMAIYNQILRGTSDAQGDAIKTTDSWNNIMVRLNGIMTDFQTEVGQQLLPLFKPLLQDVTNFIEAWSPKILDDLINNKLPAIITALGLTGDGLDTAKSKADEFLTILTSEKTNEDIVNSIISIRKTINDLGLSMATVENVLQRAKLAWLELVAITNRNVPSVASKYAAEAVEQQKVVDASNANLSRLQTEHDEILQQILDNQAQALGKLRDDANRDAYNAAISMMDGYDGGIAERAPEVRKTMYQAGFDTLQGYDDGLLARAPRSISALQQIVQAHINASNSTLGRHSPSTVFYAMGVDTMQGLINGLWSKFGELMNIARYIANQLIGTIESALQIHSPSKVMEHIGAMTAQGFYDGIEKQSNAISNTSTVFSPTIQINNPSVRNDSDIKSIARAVQIELNKSSQTYRGGYATQAV